MGVIVGRDVYHIECDDSYTLGCHQKTETLTEQRMVEAAALRSGWKSLGKTGKWMCQSCCLYYTSIRTSPVRLTNADWWKELAGQDLPEELVAMLRGLVSATLKSLIPPRADAKLILMAKNYLWGGLLLDEIFFAVLLVGPLNKEKHKTFFVFSPP